MADEQAAAVEQQEQTTLEVDEFSSLLKKEFKPKSDRAKEAVETAVQTLAEQVLRDSTIISDDVLQSIEAIVA